MSETALSIVPRANGGDIISTQEMKAALTAAKEQYELIGQFIKSIMQEGIDYGTIPGTERIDPKNPSGPKLPNPTLFKPGAEKLIAFFHCHPVFKVRRNENPELGLYAYEFKCVIFTPAGDPVAEGFGSASSWESKYRWRTAQRACPKCKQPAIQSSQYPDKNGGEFGVGSFYCFGKKGGCGAKFLATDPLILDQKLGRIQNPDMADVVNTILKMAKKRAMVDAALALGRCSDFFSQDLEDLVDVPHLPEPRDVTPPKSSKSKPAAPAPVDQVSPAEYFDQTTGEISTTATLKPATPEEEEARAMGLIKAAQNVAMLDALKGPFRALPASVKPRVTQAWTEARKAALEKEPQADHV